MRPNFFVNTPDILHAYLQYGGPAAFKIRAALAATGVAELGRLRRLRAVRARRGQARQRGVPRLGEVPDPGPRLGGRRAPRAAPWRRTSPGSTRSAARTRRCSSCATSPSTAATTTTSWCFSKRADAARRTTSDIVIVVVNLDPHAHPRDDGPPRPAGARPGLARLVPGPRRDHRRDLDLGRAQLRPARPRPRAGPRADRQEAPLSTHRDRPRTPVEAAHRRPSGSRRAVFYEVLVRSFRDSNADGTGDFRGLIEKLDYLQWLGVDCLWLPPFFTSPLRDGGYDVADYTDILPEFGTVEDFHELPRRGAQARHPGDHRLRHEPHQRRAPVVPGQPRATPTARTATSTSGPTPTSSTRTPGSSSSTPSRRTGPGTRSAAAVLLAPVLLPPAGPQLRQPEGPRGDARGDGASGSTWASTGSGSTPCPTSTSGRAPTARTSPRPTSSSKRCRKFVDDNYPGRVLLCEANQWPADVVEYFGDPEVGGDECHMASTSR